MWWSLGAFFSPRCRRFGRGGFSVGWWVEVFIQKAHEIPRFGAAKFIEAFAAGHEDATFGSLKMVGLAAKSDWDELIFTKKWLVQNAKCYPNILS